MTDDERRTTRRRLLGTVGAAGVAGAASSAASAGGNRSAAGAWAAVSGEGDRTLDGASADADTAGGRWPLFQYDAQNSGVNRRTAGPSEPVGTKWSTPTDRTNTPPLLTPNRVYVADPGANVVRALDRDSGEERWSTELDIIAPRMALQQGTLYVPGSNLYAVDAASGDLEWQAGSQGSYYGVQIRDGFAYASGFNGVEAIGLDNKNTLWTNGGVSMGDTAYAYGGGRILAVGSDNSRVRAIDPGGGNTRWKRLLGTELQGEPAFAGRSVLVPGEQTVYAIDVVTGNTSWTYEAPARGSLVVTESTVIGNTANGETFAVDLESGDELWRTATLTSHNSPVMAGGLLYLAGDDGTVGAVDPNNGNLLWDRSVADSFDTGLAVAGGELFGVSADAVTAMVPGGSTPTPTATATDTPTDAPPDTGTATPTATDAGDEEEEDDGGGGGGGGGLLIAVAAVAVLVLGGAGAVALLGLDTIREALGGGDGGGGGGSGGSGEE